MVWIGVNVHIRVYISRNVLQIVTNCPCACAYVLRNLKYLPNEINCNHIRTEVADSLDTAHIFNKIIDIKPLASISAPT